MTALLARAKHSDASEAGEPELDIPAEIERREQRVTVIQAAKQRLEERQHAADTQSKSGPDEKKEAPESPPGPPSSPEPAPTKIKRAFGAPLPKAQDNFTDLSSRIMKISSSGGFEQCFNSQTAVDGHRQIIVAAELTACGSDRAELPGMLAAAVRSTGIQPGVVLADAGCLSEAVLGQLGASTTEIIVALGREGRQQARINANKRSLTAAMGDKLQSAEGQAKYRRRKAIVEPPIAWIKQVLGVRQFSFRGILKVRAEFKFVCGALNLRRLAAMMA